ncbi:hypothetical protein GCM10017744_022520 [Streptomyces antimycoticus]|uniref:Uncharacterized protein n=1 Tax=Streptomyces antimycoticus TaxID=68175 RepID=A0A4D4KMH7_9ACTN|nr:hypothetical protein SANT12839_079550 [Streptomyces antimycoticus]
MAPVHPLGVTVAVVLGSESWACTPGIPRASAGATLGEMFNDVVRPALGPDAWFGVPDEALDRVADLEYADPNWPRQLHAAPWLRSRPRRARAGQGIHVPRKCPGTAGQGWDTRGRNRD